MEKPRIRAAFHSCLWFRAAVPVQQQRGPPFSRRATAPQEPKRFPYPYKKTARSISTGSGRFLLFSVRQRGSRSPALLSPLFPSTLRQAQQTKELLPYSLPASRKPQERRGRGRKRLLQKGLPPPVSLLHLTSTRHLPSPYAAQANDILLISLGPLDGGRHDAEALKAETLLAKQQHFIHRLLA